MKVNIAFLQTAGAVGLVLAGLSASAQDVRGQYSSVKTLDNSTIASAMKPKAPTPAARPADAASGVIDMGKLEMVTERYPDGKVKIEREVGLNTAGSYINQGSYKLYSQTGEVLKSGDFLNGNQQGKWTQTLATDRGHLFSQGKDSQFTAPFTSEATFQDGRLHGTWTITDSKGQSIIKWTFENGTPSGVWTWWHSNGKKRLEATYINGSLSGDVTEWDSEGKTLNQNNYIDGKCVIKTVGWYTLGNKHFEGTYLRASNMPQATYDWWNSKIVTSASAPAGPDVQHGQWTEWYPSGNKKSEAQYDRGVTVGKVTWWYENGQEQAEGEFEAGQKEGTWITWHANGLKQSLVEYKAGKPISKKTEWSEDGKLIDTRDTNNGNSYSASPSSAQRVYSRMR